MAKKAARLSDMVSSFGETTLHCPACDGFYLHQGRTEVFNRGEDENEGTHVVIEGDNVQTNRDLAGNPSSRRHGLTIHFTCENCPAEVQMHVYQHKGNTFVGMEYQDGEA
ncbi:hypothetical protein [Tateyamaria omphalii]|uniref:hypothetical protein n=1 Tax=Tateyamaria omphalii TaxID=299262 RepID=UPI0012FA4310|nr:hypothetical protein [Tateyamaria omphalii]